MTNLKKTLFINNMCYVIIMLIISNTYKINFIFHISYIKLVWKIQFKKYIVFEILSYMYQIMKQFLANLGYIYLIIFMWVFCTINFISTFIKF